MGVRLVVRSSWSPQAPTDFVYEFDQQRIVIGRGRGADVQIPHPAVSGQHATLRAEGSRWVLQDDDSTNGTRVGGERLPPGRPKPLRDGDLIEVGGFRIQLQVTAPVLEVTSADQTAAMARRIIREALGGGQAALEGPKVVVLNGPAQGSEAPIGAPPSRLVVGRGDDCDLSLSDADLSREHIELIPDLDGVTLRDLGSKNGTSVNARPTRERRLRDGDEIGIGRSVLLFTDQAEAELRALAEAPDQVVDLPPAPKPAAAAEPPPSPIEPVIEEEKERAAVTRPARGSRPSGRLGADVFIYALAAAVLALSIAGLVLLLGN